MRAYSIDKALYFGKVEIGSCENTLNLGKTSAGRMVIRANVTKAAVGSTGLTLKLQGSDSATGTFTDIASSLVIPVASLTAGAEVALPVPEGYDKPFLKLAASGPTSIEMEAYLDVYLGL